MMLGDEERMEDTWTGLQIGALPGQNDLLSIKLYWDIAARILFQLDSPFFQEIQQTYRLEIDRLSAETYIYEDGGFLILHSQGPILQLISMWLHTMSHRRKNRLPPGFNTARTL